MNWSEDDIYEVLNQSVVYYRDGEKRFVDIEFDYSSENISEEILNAYEFGDSEFAENILFFSDLAGAEIFLNVKNISMIELPFLNVETAIINVDKEL